MPSGVVTMPAGVVPHKQQCLLMWCLNIGHGCWCGTSIYVMPAGPLPQCSRYLTGRVQMREGWLQVWRYLYRGAMASDMSADQVPLSHMPACTVQLYQTCMLCSFIQKRVFVVFLHEAKQLVCYKFIRLPTDKVLLPLVCKPVGYHPERHLENIKF